MPLEDLAFREKPIEERRRAAARAHVAVPQPSRGNVTKAEQCEHADSSSDDTPCPARCLRHLTSLADGDARDAADGSSLPPS
jgi:hypothetical protein